MKKKNFKYAIILLLCVAGIATAKAQGAPTPYIRVSTYNVGLNFSNLYYSGMSAESNSELSVSTDRPDIIKLSINQYYTPGGYETTPPPAGPGGVYDPYWRPGYNAPYYKGYISVTLQGGLTLEQARGTYQVYVEGSDSVTITVTVQ